MYLVVSGEGETDIGKSNEAIWALNKLIDKFIELHSGFSLLEVEMLEVVYEIRISEISRDRQIIKLFQYVVKRPSMKLVSFTVQHVL